MSYVANTAAQRAAMLETVGKVKVKSLTLVEGDDTLAGQAKLASDKLKHAEGVDVPALLQRFS